MRHECQVVEALALVGAGGHRGEVDQGVGIALLGPVRLLTCLTLTDSASTARYVRHSGSGPQYEAARWLPDLGHIAQSRTRRRRDAIHEAIQWNEDDSGCRGRSH